MSSERDFRMRLIVELFCHQPLSSTFKKKEVIISYLDIYHMI